MLSTGPAQIPRRRPCLNVKAAIENGYVPAVNSPLLILAMRAICRALGDIGNLVGPFNTRCNVGKENATKKPVLTEKAAQVGQSTPSELWRSYGPQMRISVGSSYDLHQAQELRSFASCCA